jgi:hypothetical protein
MESLIRLRRENGRLLLERAGGPDLPVTLAWARPITARGREFVLLDEAKREVLMLEGPESLDAASAALAQEELAGAYVIPRILRVLRTETVFGTQYWDVETDRGPRRFAVKSDNRNAAWVDADHLVLRDTLGCRYDIRPFSALDAASHAAVEKVM